MSFSASDISESKEYRHLLSLPYSDVLPFVIEYIKKRSAITGLFLVLAMINITWLILFRIELMKAYTFVSILPYTVGGLILFPIVLILPHELLHIIPYFLFGARKIRIGGNLKDYYFYVSAPDFPVGRFKFIVIALTPLISISAIIIVMIFSLDKPLWCWSLLLTLFVHFTMSAGDIALINFYWINRSKKIITWDDANEKVAYFYARVKKQKIDR
ncbi:MAG: DUF3267 domain-containing protein [Marinilabiliaceae bacterium]|jgi:hypothetical protein|nr:DUF3267 domain-containing protein [Marinilabiliaceae bacterium]